MNISYEISPAEAPGCILISNDRDDRTVLMQVDYDYPGLASAFGWQPCCDATDGTVDCSHKNAGEHIHDAYEFLMAHEGEEVEDPGYFGD